MRHLNQMTYSELIKVMNEINQEMVDCVNKDRIKWSKLYQFYALLMEESEKRGKSIPIEQTAAEFGVAV